MRLALIAVTLIAGLGTGAIAQTYLAENRLTVVPLNGADFEVIEARGEGPRGIWCAAAGYALNKKRMQTGQRIYIKTARGPSVSGAGRTGVVFTTDASRLSQGPSQAFSVGTRTVGQGLPIAHAIQFCRDYLIEPEDTFYRLKGN
jgi:hypothetical protein